MALRLLALRPRRAAPLLATARTRACSQLSVEAYHSIVSLTLESVQEVYEEEADDDPALAMDVEYADGVLNVVVGDHGTFVLNKQAPNLQLWLSSPVSGPLRYYYSSEAVAWLNQRDDHELLPLLADDFETLCGKRLDFGRVADALREAHEDAR